MDLLEALDSFDIKYVTEGEHHHARHGWAQVDCPWCETVGKYHLGINIDHGYANCWKCGRRDLPAVIAALGRVSYTRAKSSLHGVVRRRRSDREPRIGGRVVSPKGLRALSQPHKRYLKDRGFNADDLERLWGLKGFGPAGRYAWRIWIPIHLRGELMSWTTRSINPEERSLRYVSASLEQEALPHKSLLYGADYCRHVCVVHEGPTDVWATGPGAVATFGVDYGREQLKRIAAFNTRYVCFDNSPSAQRRAKELAAELDLFEGETYNIQLDADDPGSASRREIKQLRRLLK